MLNQTIRSELKKRRKHRRWRRLRNFFIFSLIAGTMWQAWNHVHDPNFAFGSIQVSGTRKLSNDEILQMSNCSRPINIINLSTSKIEKAIKNDVRFISGKCRYEWPGVLHVTVIERSPALYVSDNYGSYVKVDYEGIIMSVTKGVPDSYAPVLVNEYLENVFIGDKVNSPRILAILKFMNGLTFDACHQFSEIRVDEHNNLHVMLKTGMHIVVGILADASDRAPTFMSVLKELGENALDAEFIDMRFTKPYIRLRQGSKKNSEKK